MTKLLLRQLTNLHDNLLCIDIPYHVCVYIYKFHILTSTILLNKNSLLKSTVTQIKQVTIWSWICLFNQALEDQCQLLQLLRSHLTPPSLKVHTRYAHCYPPTYFLYYKYTCTHIYTNCVRAPRLHACKRFEFTKLFDLIFLEWLCVFILWIFCIGWKYIWSRWDQFTYAGAEFVGYEYNGSKFKCLSGQKSFFSNSIILYVHVGAKLI